MWSAVTSAVGWRGECKLKLISWSPTTGEQFDIRSLGDGHFSTLYGDNYTMSTTFQFRIAKITTAQMLAIIQHDIGRPQPVCAKFISK